MQKRGVTFTNYIVTDSLCCPSRSSIFTGRFPHDTGIFRNTGADGGYLPFRKRGLEKLTFATALVSAGYRTGMMGKYLNGYLPERHPPPAGWTTWAVAGHAYKEFGYSLNQDGKVVNYGKAPGDALIDTLQAAVAAIGEQDNTCCVFSSDNGYHMGEHRLMPGKMTAYDTDIRVPLIVTGPGVPAGVVVEQIVENIDLCPTFVELGGAVPPPAINGRSLVPLLHGQKVTEWRTAALIEHHGPHDDPTDPDAPALRSGNPSTYEAVRTRSSVCVEYVDGDREFHDFAADPNELINGYGSLADGERAALHSLVERLKNCHSAAACAEAELSRSAVNRK